MRSLNNKGTADDGTSWVTSGGPSWEPSTSLEQPDSGKGCIVRSY